MKNVCSNLVVSELLGFKPYKKHHPKYPSTEREMLGIDPIPHRSRKIILTDESLSDHSVVKRRTAI